MPEAQNRTRLQWEDYEQTIRSLYVEHSIKELRERMASQHNFYATESQFEYRLKKWGCRKNKTSQIWTDLSIKVAKRGRNNKESAISHHDKRIPDRVAKKEMSRNARLSTIAQAWNAPTPQTPAGYLVFTPESPGNIMSSHRSEHCVANLERHLAPSQLLGSGPNSPYSTESSLTEVSSPTDAHHQRDLSVNLSPPSSSNMIKVVGDNNNRLVVLSPSIEEELKSLDQVYQIEEVVLHLRQYEAAGRTEEATDIWMNFMRQIYESADELRLSNACDLIFQGRELYTHEVERLFESCKTARVQEHGIHDQLTTDLYLAYITFLLKLLSGEGEETDQDLAYWKSDITANRITKTFVLLEEILDAYFSEEAKSVLMPASFSEDSYLIKEQTTRPTNGFPGVRVLEEIARVCIKEPILASIMAWKPTYDGIRLSYETAGAISELVEMGIAATVTARDGKQLIRLLPRLLPRNEEDGH